MVSSTTRNHGGPNALGAAQFDFSTNSNGCGPCPYALAAVQQADPTRYPDPTYSALRASLADFYAVAPWRIVLAGSASEFIFRITAYAQSMKARTASVPVHAYGDYAHAAQAFGLQCATDTDPADLVWLCEPSSPMGQSNALPLFLKENIVVLDRAYEVLRLSGQSAIHPALRSQIWQLFTPNKALGLTGVRGAFAIAPENAASQAEQLQAMAPSWAVGAHGVAMLDAWTHAEAQHWLAKSLEILQKWKLHQIDGLSTRGWTVQPSETPFFTARPPEGLNVQVLCSQLRIQGIQLRDASSFGLPEWVRLSVQHPDTQTALFSALDRSTS